MSATEKLVRIEADGITKYFRPSAVQAIEGRMFGCDVYLANADRGKPAKVFVSQDPDRVALLLGLA